MSRQYTLDHMDDIVLQRTFNYYAIRNPFKRWFVQAQRWWQGARDDIRLSEIYAAFAQGKTFEDIQDLFVDINPKTILLGRAFYHAANPDRKHDRKRRYLRVLCDANIDESYLTDGARQVFGYASHINFEGLTHAKDSLIWARANGKFNMIITKDRAFKESLKEMDTIDLTRCARLRWETILKANDGHINEAIRQLPVLIQIKDASLNGTQIKNLLRKNRDVIMDLYDARVSPIIEVHNDRVKPGIHFLELIEGGTKGRSKKLRDQLVKYIEENLIADFIRPDNKNDLRVLLKTVVAHHLLQEILDIESPVKRRAYLKEYAQRDFDSEFIASQGFFPSLLAAAQRQPDPLLKTIKERAKIRQECGFVYVRPDTMIFSVP